MVDFHNSENDLENLASAAMADGKSSTESFVSSLSQGQCQKQTLMLSGRQSTAKVYTDTTVEG